LKIALVHDWLTGMRGGEKCLEILCRRFPDAELFTLLHAPGSTSPAIERMRIRTSFLQRLPTIERHYRYCLPLLPRAIRSLRIPAGVDLVLSFSHAVAKSIQTPPGVPHVCYCFTPMRYAWHMRSEYFQRPAATAALSDARFGRSTSVLSQAVRQPMVRARNLLLDRLQRWDRATSDRVTHFVAISETIAERIADCYQRESTVIYPPVDTDFYTPAPASSAPREDFYLCVSALVPYKRLELAIAACERLGRRLVIIGAGPERRKLERCARSSATSLGWQPNEVIRDHLRRCRALLFPGHEDFGIVPVEAQACGAPVIALARGGATETIVGADDDHIGSGVFFQEPTVESLVDALRWFECHPRQVCPSLGRSQAERFTAARYERELLAYLDQIYNKGVGSALSKSC
jgi:glycosyltransferase involved in cell wall biosynthesis